MRKQKTFTVHPKTKDQIEALKAIAKALKLDFKFTTQTEDSYDPDFVSKIEESRRQAKMGQTVQMDLDDIWKE